MQEKKYFYLILFISLIVIIAIGFIIWQNVSLSGKTSPEMPYSSNPLTLLKGSPNFGYTHLQPDGNRFMPGNGSLPDSRMIDIQLSGKPRWIVAAPLDAGSIWAVVLEDGRVQAFKVGIEVEPISILPDKLPKGMPPLLMVNDGIPIIVTPPAADVSTLTHPVVLNNSKQIAFIDTGGNLILWNEKETARFEVNALPDSRILVDEKERLLFLTGATSLYDHGVLGDKIEATSITLLETTGKPGVALTITVPEQTVIEGISPIWVDMDGDGVREIIVTTSTAESGAQVIVYDQSGGIKAKGPVIGKGYRWRHQIAVASFGMGGELELVDVLTPHIGGVVEFFGMSGNTLMINARVSGYTSHVMGSRNLDMAVSGDFDGDGNVELLVPNQGLTKLGGIGRTESGAVVKWNVPAGGRISTNLAVVTLSDETMAVGVGRDDGILRLWLP